VKHTKTVYWSTRSLTLRTAQSNQENGRASEPSGCKRKQKSHHNQWKAARREPLGGIIARWKRNIPLPTSFTATSAAWVTQASTSSVMAVGIHCCQRRAGTAAKSTRTMRSSAARADENSERRNRSARSISLRSVCSGGQRMLDLRVQLGESGLDLLFSQCVCLV